MDETTDRDIIFLYTLREDGAIVRLSHRHKLSPVGELDKDEKKFMMDHINNEMELNAIGSYIPSGQIRAYIVKESKKPLYGRDHTSFINHLQTNKESEPLFNHNLRTLGFLKECGWRGEEFGNFNEFLREILRTQPGELASFHNFHTGQEANRLNCEVTAIETKKGVALFDNSGYGRMAEHNCLRYMAEHYFDASFKENTGFINRFHFLTSDPRIIDLSREGYKFIRPNSFEFDINSQSHDSTVLRDLKPYEKIDIEPNYESFQHMLYQCGITPDKRMNELLYLTYIVDKGYDGYKVEEYTANNELDSAQAFSGIRQRFEYMDNLHPEKNSIRPELNKETAMIATRILRDKYGARGFVPEHKVQTAFQQRNRTKPQLKR